MKNWRSIGASQDFWSGVIFVCVGLGFFAYGRTYSLGTARSIGPAYFPTLLGGLLALIGLAVILRALFRPGPGLERPAWGKLALVTAPVVLFALLVRPLGLAASITLLVFLSALASTRFKWSAALALAAGLALGASILFVLLLGLPIPIVGTWLGG